MNNFKKIPATNQSLALRRSVYGVGLNDAGYMVNIIVNGKKLTCHAYVKWVAMLKRCYSSKYQEEHQTYIGCSVCNDWLSFSVFEKWFDENNIEEWALDKDIKTKGNKIYSPETCLFVPHSVNSFLVGCDAIRGNYPKGVSFHNGSGSYQSSIRIDCKKKSLGFYKTPELARSAYVKAKNNEIKRKCEEYPQFSKYLINHLLEA